MDIPMIPMTRHKEEREPGEIVYFLGEQLTTPSKFKDQGGSRESRDIPCLLRSRRVISKRRFHNTSSFTIAG